MNIFFICLLSWIVAGTIINVLTRILLRSHLDKALLRTINNKDDYLKGYGIGITNLKMYYYTTGNIPPISWLDSKTHTILNTREKLEETLDADTKAKLYADA